VLTCGAPPPPVGARASPIKPQKTKESRGAVGFDTKPNRNMQQKRTMLCFEPCAEEKRVLVRCQGWGGLPQVFDIWNEQWKEQRKRLEQLPDPGELQLARASTLNAHYTAPSGHPGYVCGALPTSCSESRRWRSSVWPVWSCPGCDTASSV
jgi:hypothetical protein